MQLSLLMMRAPSAGSWKDALPWRAQSWPRSLKKMITCMDLSLCRGCFQCALNRLHQFRETVWLSEERHSHGLAHTVADPRAA
jgi:hypothetical protein